MNTSNEQTISPAHIRASRQSRIASIHSDAGVPPLMHGNNWHGQDVSGWWASEKFNGWRAYWTGSRLVSRYGKDYNAPAWFTDGLPSYPLDCELWIGREQTDADVHRAIAAKAWFGLRLAVFDVPGLKAEAAIALLREIDLGSFAFAAKFQRVRSAEEARRGMLEIVAKGGEGIMLRRPGSEYHNTRTDDLLKLKP